MKFPLFWRTVFFLFVAAAVQAAPRVALMNFSTDDNSYRSAQNAADFNQGAGLNVGELKALAQDIHKER
jgi:hypothetical protein